MKTLIKITLLIAAIALSVWGVLHWKDTVAKEPPTQFAFTNNHSADLEYSIGEIGNLNDFNGLEIAYNSCIYMWRRYQDEHLVSSTDADRLLQLFLERYKNKFVEKSNECFNQSEWDTDPWNHKFMKDRIAMLEQLGRGHLSENLQTISNLLEKYDQAMQQAQKTRLRDIKDIKLQDQQDSLILAGDNNKLRNCQKLVDYLNRAKNIRRENCIDLYRRKSDSLKRPEVKQDVLESHFRELDKFITDCEEIAVYYNNKDDMSVLIKNLLDGFAECLRDNANRAEELIKKPGTDWESYNDAHNAVFNWTKEYEGWLGDQTNEIVGDLSNCKDRITKFKIQYESTKDIKSIRSKEEWNSRQDDNELY